MKKILSFTLVLAMMLALAVPAFAADPLSYPLNQGDGPFDWKNYIKGTDFGISESEGAFVPGYKLGTDGTVFWHFVNPDDLGGYANITFLNENNQEVTFNNVYSYKNDHHFAVITLQSWKLLSAEYFPTKTPGKNGTKFNLSHTSGKELTGALKVSVHATKEHEKVTLQNFLVCDVQEFYERDVNDNYIPVFEKKISSTKNDTLTSQLTGNAGGKFNNGMVWLAIDVNKARTPEGYQFGIAYSDPKNTPVEYKYNVKIVDDKLVVSFDDRFIGARVTAKVYSTAPSKHDNSGHVQLKTGGELAVNLPKNAGDKVYLYVHFEGGISWYTTGNYEFVEWRYKDTKNGDYGLEKTVIGEDKLVETKKINSETVIDHYGAEFNLVVKDASGNAVFKDTVANNGEVIIPNLVPGEYTVILSGDDIDKQTECAVVGAGTTEVDFSGITVTGALEEVYLEDVCNKNILDPIYSDRTPAKVVHLGNEKDPYDVNAIRLN